MGSTELADGTPNPTIDFDFSPDPSRPIEDFESWCAFVPTLDEASVDLFDVLLPFPALLGRNQSRRLRPPT